jgi:hypothetical protein
MTKSERMMWAAHVQRKARMTNAYKGWSQNLKKEITWMTYL